MTKKNVQRVVILCSTALLLIIYMIFGDKLSQVAFAIKFPVFAVYAILVGLIVKQIGKR